MKIRNIDFARVKAWQDRTDAQKARHTLAKRANDALKGSRARAYAPRLNAFSDREDLIGWMVCNDGNGCFTDEDSIAEGWDPMTIEDAWSLLQTILEEV